MDILQSFYIVLLTVASVPCVIPLHTNIYVPAGSSVPFTSPGYDKGNYPWDVEYSWHLSSDTNTRLSILFDTFDLEFHPTCSWDNVTLRNSTCNDDVTHEPTTLCGVHESYDYQNDGNQICVTFKSDKVVTKKGFQAHVTATKIQPESATSDALSSSVSTSITTTGNPTTNSTNNLLNVSSKTQSSSTTPTSPSETSFSTLSKSEETPTQSKPGETSTHSVCNSTASSTKSSALLSVITTKSATKLSSSTVTTSSVFHSSSFSSDNVPHSTVKSSTKLSTAEPLIATAQSSVADSPLDATHTSTVLSQTLPSSSETPLPSTSSSTSSPETSSQTTVPPTAIIPVNTSSSSSTLTSTAKLNITVTFCEVTSAEIDVNNFDHILLLTPVDQTGNYPTNRHCTITLKNVLSLETHIEFQDFHVEEHPTCSWDYLLVMFDTDSPDKLCGQTLPEALTTTSSTIAFVFHSDYVVPDKGIRLTVSAKSDVSNDDSTTSNNPSTKASTSVTIVSTSSAPEPSNSTNFTNTSPQPVFNVSNTAIMESDNSGTSSQSATNSTTSAIQSSSSTNEATSNLTPPITTSTEENSEVNTIAPSSALPESSSSTLTTWKSSTSVPESQQSTSPAPLDSSAIHQPVGSDVIDICSDVDNILLSQTKYITSPGYSENEVYPLNADCSIDVVTEIHQHVVLTIEDFDLELNTGCSWDHLTLEDRSKSTRFCGYLDHVSLDAQHITCAPNYIRTVDDSSQRLECLLHTSTKVEIADTKQLKLRFFSDHIVQKRGFNISLSPVDDINTINTTSGPSSSSNSSTAISSPIVSTAASLTHAATTSTLIETTEAQSTTETSTPQAPSSISTNSAISESLTGSTDSPTIATESSTKPTIEIASTTSTAITTSAEHENPQSTAQSGTTDIPQDGPVASNSTISPPIVTPSSSILVLACSGGEPLELTGDSGVIESPGFQEGTPYPANTLCRWLIKNPKKQIIAVIFEQFNIENSVSCKWDSLAFYGVEEVDVKLIDSLCGSHLPSSLHTSKDLLIEFVSDNVQQRAGFRFRFIKSNGAFGHSCPAGNTPCPGSGECIPVEWWCDNIVDCQNGADEDNCGQCSSHEFMCDDRTCISTEQRCDGHIDCSTDNDEISCVSMSEAGPVEVDLAGENYALCHDAETTNAADELCKKAGYRSSTAVWGGIMTDEEVARVDKTTGLLQFSVSEACPSNEAAHIRCHGSGCGSKSESYRRKRIIGGSVSNSGEWPWNVALRAGNSLICGGIIISDMWVLTAGHCVNNMMDNPQVLNIEAGLHDLNAGDGQLVYVSELNLHPDYSFIFNADIALLKLQQPLNFTDEVQPICLPWDQRTFSAASTCYVAGYGVSDMKDYYTTLAPRFLRHIRTKIVDVDSCREKYAYKTYIKDSMICAGYTGGGMDACKGDSGGGLMCEADDGRWILAGIVSWGDMCGNTNRPGVYTRVSSFLDWVENTIKEPESNTVNCTFEDHWCGYTDMSTDKYFWTRKPGDKYVKGTVMYASRPGTYAVEPANATLTTPVFSNYDVTCLSFRFVFSSNSNITLSLYGLTEADATFDDVTSVLLWQMRSNYPSKDTWVETEVSVPKEVVRLLFVSLHQIGGIYGVGLDNVTMVQGVCQGSAFMNCDFNNQSTCMYSQASGQNIVAWQHVNFASVSHGGYIQAGGPFNTFGYFSASQLVSPPVTHTFTSIPHCASFRFKLFTTEDTELTLATYMSVNGQLNNPTIYWKSVNVTSTEWTAVAVSIGMSYYNHVVFEVRRQGYTSSLIQIGLDDIKITDGLCVH